MKAILFADAHLRSDRLDIGRRFMEAVLIACKLEGAKLCLCAGDLLHEKIGFTQDVLIMLNDKLEEFKEAGVDFFWIRGNHEIAMQSRPHQTIMTLFQNTCHTIIEPRVYRTPAFAIYMLPWYTAEMYRTRAKHMARETYKDQDKIRILITHQGFNEGTVSASNTRISSGVSIKEVYPDEYDWVLCGDYHHRQYLTKNALYLGCPYSHQHGDDVRNEIDVIDFTAKTFDTLSLPLVFPKHITFDVPDPGDFSLTGFDEANYNRIRCHIDYAKSFRERYPSRLTQIDPWGRPTNKKGQERRIKTLDTDYNHVLDTYLKEKKYGALHYQFAREAIEEVMAVVG